MSARGEYALSAGLSLLLSAISWWQLLTADRYSVEFRGSSWYLALFLGLVGIGLLSLSLFVVLIFEYPDRADPQKD